MNLSHSALCITLDNKVLIDKLKNGKNAVYEHLALERIELLEKELKQLKEALRDGKQEQ